MAMQREKIRDSRGFRQLPDPSLHYGLQVFVNPKDVRWPWLYEWVPARWRVTNDPTIGLYAFNDLPVTKSDEKILTWFSAVCGDTRVIIIPKNFRATTPINVRFCGGEAPTVGHLVVVAESGSACDIIFQDDEGSGDRAVRIDIMLKEHATLQWYSAFSARSEKQQFIHTSTYLGKNAMFSQFSSKGGVKYLHDRTVTTLVGDGAHAAQYTALVGQGYDRIDSATKIMHRAPATTSMVRSYNLLSDHAKAIVRQCTTIDDIARGSVAHQKEQSLMLSPTAEVDAQPNLEISTDDVVCGHSASVTRVDPEQIFYVMSRGLSEEDARDVIVKGFLAPVVEQLTAVGLTSIWKK